LKVSIRFVASLVWLLVRLTQYYAAEGLPVARWLRSSVMTMAVRAAVPATSPLPQARVPMRPVLLTLVAVVGVRGSPGTRRMRPIVCVFAFEALAPPARIELATSGSIDRTSARPQSQSQSPLNYISLVPPPIPPAGCLRCAFSVPSLCLYSRPAPRGVCFGAGVWIGRFSKVHLCVQRSVKPWQQRKTSATSKCAVQNIITAIRAAAPPRPPSLRRARKPRVLQAE
jgi:hypothetical protein